MQKFGEGLACKHQVRASPAQPTQFSSSNHREKKSVRNVALYLQIVAEGRAPLRPARRLPAKELQVDLNPIIRIFGLQLQQTDGTQAQRVAQLINQLECLNNKQEFWTERSSIALQFFSQLFRSLDLVLFLFSFFFSQSVQSSKSLITFLFFKILIWNLA